MRNRKRLMALALASAVTITALPMGLLVKAGDTKEDTSNMDLSYDGYTKVWSDEFEGDSLNRDNWNVETHEAGWVNSELQEYVDSTDNIQVKDGKLYITPIKTSTSVESTGAANLLQNADFASGMTGWTETIANWGGDYVTDASSSTANGAIKYTINNPGTEDWHVQLKQSGISLEAGKTYTVSYTVNSTAARNIKSGVMSTSYVWYGGSDPAIEANTDTAISFDFTMENSDSAADFYISLGKVGDTPASTVTISDISFTEKGAEETTTTTEKSTYTSGRISTQNKETFTYGMFEVRAKVPEGMGYLPAFWLMANDENTYGQWPRCGEIDCMEVMGQDTDTAYGTIHYGNPHSQSQGTYTLSEDSKSFSDDFHTFTCEWNPDSIKWYVDGVLYHEESDWYSTTENQGTVSYPAPFDQPFYIILNLAVGGSWVGYPDETTSFDNNPYIVDYVRVYQKSEEEYAAEEAAAKRPENTATIREANADGNYLNNGDFSSDEDLTDDSDWKFLTALGGEATATIDNGLTIETTNDGTVDYSVQLVQADLPFVKGATYQIDFDAYASADREMGVDIKAPDHGYTTYMPHQTAELTTETKHYTYTFTMNDATDANGRLEYNMGATGSTATIYLSNVSVKKIADPDPNAKEVKTVLANGNYIYNGAFQEGDSHLGYWTLSEKADASVTSLADGRRLKVTGTATLTQEDLAFSSGNTYTLSFDAAISDEPYTVTTTVGGKTYTTLVDSKESKNYSISLPANASYSDQNISFAFSGNGSIYFDNAKLVESALIKNGSFNDGTSGFEIYVDSSAKASYVVDSLSEDNALDFTIKDTSTDDWRIQVKQNNVKLEKGKTYTLTLKAKSDMARDIRVIMQGDESHGWAVYSNDNIMTLSEDYTTLTDTFTMNADTDETAFLSICLGKVNEQITDQHRVVIDEISLVEVTEDTSDDDSDPSLKPSDDNKTDSDKDIKGDSDKKVVVDSDEEVQGIHTLTHPMSDAAAGTSAKASTSEATSAQTGDSTSPLPFVVALLAGLAAFVAGFLFRRRSHS